MGELYRTIRIILLQKNILPVRIAEVPSVVVVVLMPLLVYKVTMVERRNITISERLFNSEI